ncbi:hypothetical protein E3O19_07220 [Cryobacterium algoritolerans]|uniref:Uncharacterized protein n=1 Tax=Cryobacterium algoritolerans TaxID=1259184 RepID=A0A4V3IF44_9MICO|nr:hypothetical protein [Cryobacterium algoritolerans]TFC16340.1 hypothetical protein E3O19_07220 [Cryobacterium algoritolerans]
MRDIDKTWLDAVVDRERTGLRERGTTPLLVVADPEHRATAFTADHRVAITALIGAICSARGFDPCSLVVQVADGTARTSSGPNLLNRPAGQAGPGRTPPNLAATAGSGGAAAGQIATTTGSIATAPGSTATVTELAARERRVATVTIQVGIDLPERRLRRLLRPYLAVLRVVFGRVRVSMRRPLLMLEFDDERGPTSIRRGLSAGRWAFIRARGKYAE